VAKKSNQSRSSKRSPRDVTDAESSATDAGLIHVTDATAGISRKRVGKGFTYWRAKGTRIRDAATLSRIRSLAIPPAWEKVWICAADNGHLQATGFDARRRKQYRYHPQWRESRDELKYERMIAFAEALPKIRKRVRRDLALKRLSRKKVTAAVIRLLEYTLIRVGNEEYAKTNNSFGLTTMLDKHVHVAGSHICFEFRGKSGVEHHIDLTDRRLAHIVSQCQHLPGQELFQYVSDDGQVQDISSSDVNEYLHEVAGQEFTAKDFRTWAGTALAAQALQEIEEFDTQAAAKRNITQAIEKVAARLGNTKAICRKCYIHPAVIAAYLDKTLVATLKKQAEKELSENIHSLSPEEAAVLALLRQRMERELSGTNGRRRSRKARARSNVKARRS
jgi:DNA topoisomerase I